MVTIHMRVPGSRSGPDKGQAWRIHIWTRLWVESKEVFVRMYTFGVQQAVDEFCKEHGLQVSHIAADGYMSFTIGLP